MGKIGFLIAVALATLGEHEVFAVERYKGGTESKQGSFGFNFGGMVFGDSFVRYNEDTRTYEKMAELAIEVPRVKLELFGKTYSVGGDHVSLPVRIVPDFENKNTAALWDPEERVIKIPEKMYDISQRTGVLKLWNRVYDNDDKVADNLRHEAIHALVDTKYKKSFEDENGNRTGEVDDYYHFMSEMLAYVGGSRMPVWLAAKTISSKHDLYKGASVIADKFRNNEKYTPPHVKKNRNIANKVALDDLNGMRDEQLEEKVNTKPVSMDDLKKMDLDDSNGDWCQCANPGCAKEINRENGKLKSFYIGFRCAHCKKVNVKFAKEALCYEKLIKDAGGDSQWLGQNAEADAKAAGNVK